MKKNVENFQKSSSVDIYDWLNTVWNHYDTIYGMKSTKTEKARLSLDSHDKLEN